MILLHRPGPWTTVQDGGRHGLMHLGVPCSGPLDDWSHAVANALVGNPLHAAALEITFGGVSMSFAEDSLIAICGAEVPVRIDGFEVGQWRPIAVAAGARLDIGAARLGMRIYLAVAGGIATEAVLGSRSQSMQGPILPGPLRAGASLPLPGGSNAVAPSLFRRLQQGGRRCVASAWWANGADALDLRAVEAIRLIPGTHADRLEDAELAWRQRFTLGSASNRMAAILEGPSLRLRDSGAALLSEPVAPGTVQLPPHGQPIVLLADAQTIGGYARIAHVIGVDLARLAQRVPGREVRASLLDIDTARGLWRHRRRNLARLALWARARLQE